MRVLTAVEDGVMSRYVSSVTLVFFDAENHFNTGDILETHSLTHLGAGGRLAYCGEGTHGHSNGDHKQVWAQRAYTLTLLMPPLAFRVITEDQKLDVYMKIVRLLLEVRLSAEGSPVRQ